MPQDMSTAPMGLLNTTNGYGQVPTEVTYPFLDLFGTKIDEFGSSDEGFRAYLETQLNQQGLPEFQYPPAGGSLSTS